MGDVSALKGLDVSLIGPELETFEKLDQKNVLESANLDNRFRHSIFSHTHYDIIPPTSNTHKQYKICAGKTYFDMSKSHCTDIKEYK